MLKTIKESDSPHKSRKSGKDGFVKKFIKFF
jgi:hypothetical protein